jgi:hypothetical protein
MMLFTLVSVMDVGRNEERQRPLYWCFEVAGYWREAGDVNADER